MKVTEAVTCSMSRRLSLVEHQVNALFDDDHRTIHEILDFFRVSHFHV